jgi:CO/xanthine dehydrogenase Mo-binding subunit
MSVLSRREFIQALASTSGGLLIGCSAEPVLTETPAPEPAPAPSVPVRFGAYVEITAGSEIVIVCPQSEMGQGVHDGLAKIVAEELDADWARVSVRLPWADDAFVNPTTGRQRTANSESTIVYFDVLRRAGAAARAMLISAAAARWQVEAAACRSESSRVWHDATGRSLDYGSLAAAAATLPVPAEPQLKPTASFRLIGSATPRKDTPGKCDGTAVFGLDVRLPHMLYACLRRSPAVQSTVQSFERASVDALPGVVDVFEIPEGIAVVADSTWHAHRAAEQLDAQFDTSACDRLDEATIRAALRSALDDDARALPGRPAIGGAPYDRAATLSALAAAPIRRQWEYEVPFLAHAALEPLCATALLRTDGHCEVWAPSQQPDRARDAMAQITGLPREACRLNVTFLGGGFGRKWELDFIRQAVHIAQRVKDRPVKLTWSREQDFAHDRFRPAHRVRTRVGLDRRGEILAMHSRTTGISMWKYQNRPPMPGVGDVFATGLLFNERYDIAHKYVDYVETPMPIPVGTWRSVSQSMNTFFSESAIDDVAAATRRDPLEIRRHLCRADTRALAVLERAADLAGWGAPRSRGRGLGLALGMGYDSYCAQAVAVDVRGRQVSIERIVCVFDCGLVIDPRNVEAQLEGAIIWGLSAAIDGQIRFTNGVARETNFHEGPVLRLNQTPRIEVHLLRGAHRPGGVGEAGVPPLAPALASAIHAATGERPRRLPLIASGYKFGG